jgi:hypothetical protein
VVEEIIGRLPELTGAQIAHLEYELRHERRRRASAGGDRTLPASERTPRCPSRKSWNTAPTGTAICSWSYAATSDATAQPVNVDPTGTSSSTRVASVRSSTLARPTIRSVLWPPNGQCCSVLSLLLSEPREVLDCSVRQWAYIPKC